MNILIIKNYESKINIKTLIHGINPLINLNFVYAYDISNEIHYDIMSNMYDGLIILGGPHSLVCPSENDLKFINYLKLWIDHNINILGICLGAQLIAASLGYNIKKLEKPIIGYGHPITLNLNLNMFNPDEMKGKIIDKIIDKIHDKLSFILCNHSDYIEMDLIENKRNLIKVIGYVNYQNIDIPYIIKYKNAYGVQFHPEVTSNLPNIIDHIPFMINLNNNIQEKDIRDRIIKFVDNNKDDIINTSTKLIKNWLEIIYNDRICYE